MSEEKASAAEKREKEALEKLKAASEDASSD